MKFLNLKSNKPNKNKLLKIKNTFITINNGNKS